MTKVTIEQIIDFIKLNGGEYTVQYTPLDSIMDTESCYDMYYGGASKFTIYRDGYVKDHVPYKFTDKEKDINDIYEYLKHNVNGQLHNAMEKLGWEFEALKYFDRDETKHKLFIDTIMEFRNID
jgi:hypothetical protein